MARGVPDYIRDNVFAECPCCAHCGSTVSELTIDHILPKSAGGTNDEDNLIGLCKRCNHHKGMALVDIDSFYFYASENKKKRAIKYWNLHKQNYMPFQHCCGVESQEEVGVTDDDGYDDTTNPWLEQKLSEVSTYEDLCDLITHYDSFLIGTHGVNDDDVQCHIYRSTYHIDNIETALEKLCVGLNNEELTLDREVAWYEMYSESLRHEYAEHGHQKWRWARMREAESRARFCRERAVRLGVLRRMTYEILQELKGKNKKGR